MFSSTHRIRKETGGVEESGAAAGGETRGATMGGGYGQMHGDIFHSSPLQHSYSYSSSFVSPSQDASRFRNIQSVPPTVRDIVRLKTLDEEKEEDNDQNIINSCIIEEPVEKLQKPCGPLLSEIDDLVIQEALIVKDIFFVLLGYEGNYIHYSRSYDPYSLDSSIQGPDFKFAKNLDISLKNIARKVSHVGKHYSGLRAFIHLYDNELHGKIVQAFCQAVSECFESYYIVLLDLEKGFLFSNKFNTNILDQVLDEQIANKLDHLYHIALSICTMDRKRATTILASDDSPGFELGLELELEPELNTSTVGAAESNIYTEKAKICKGGLVLKIIQDRMAVYKGDSSSYKFLAGLFDSVSIDYVAMLNRWLVEGLIDDPFDEFMIRIAKLSSKVEAQFRTKSEFYWSELFLIKKDGLLDQFKNFKIQQKILNTGKYLSIFKMCTGLQNFQSLNETFQLVDSLSASDLELKIDKFYERANKMLIKLLFEGYKLGNLIAAYQTSFLLDNSFNVDSFLDTAYSELKRNKYKTAKTALQRQYNEVFKDFKGKMETETSVGTQTNLFGVIKKNQNFRIAIENLYNVIDELMAERDFTMINNNDHYNYKEASNNAREVIEAITSNTKSRGHNDSIDESAFLSVDLSVPLPFPLNLVMVRQTSYQYEIMFKFLFMLKFVSKQGDISWRELKSSKVWINRSFSPKAQKWILRCRNLHSRIRAFVNEVQSYIAYDVIDFNYAKLQSSLNQFEERSFYALPNYSNDHDTFQVFKSNLRGANNSSNSIFDARIDERNLNLSAQHEENSFTVTGLTRSLQRYTTTLLNDSLLTRPETMKCAKEMFNFISLFHNYTMQMKRTLILINHDLQKKFVLKTPEKFDKPMDDASVNRRFDYMEESFFVRYQQFGELLGNFLQTIKTVGENENRKLLDLSDRLEACFPE